MSSAVVAGLPHPRATWPAELSRWSTSGAAPVEFLTCLTGNEVRALLAGGRTVDLVLLDAASGQVDPELTAAVRAAGSIPVGVEAPHCDTDWSAMGVAAHLPGRFTWPQLSDVLLAHCTTGGHAERSNTVELSGAPGADGFLLAVCGPGGTGASTVAMALAQATGDSSGVSTLLVDGARRADMAMYHDTGDVLPGIPELIERVRGGTADPEHLDQGTFGTRRGYDLMLGQRSPGDWVGLDRPSVAAAIEATLRRWQVVIVDHDGDLENTEWTRSESTDARNAVSLELARMADLWVIVAAAGTKGISSAARAVDEASRIGVEQHRIQVVFNRVGRSVTTRTTLRAALEATTAARADMTLAPAFVPESRHLEAAHRDGARLPKAIVGPLATAFSSARSHLFSAPGSGATGPDGQYPGKGSTAARSGGPTSVEAAAPSAGAGR